MRFFHAPKPFPARVNVPSEIDTLSGSLLLLSLTGFLPLGFMTKKEQRLVHKIEKAGIKASLKENHVLTKEELLELKIQILPTSWRIILALLAFVSFWLSVSYFKADDFTFGAISLALFFMLLAFSIFGVRRTLEEIVENWGFNSGTNLILELAIEGILKAFSSVSSDS